ncbi:oligosaccharide flippase family protein [Hyphomicrobium sp.]|uniref:oligosaccharide flippase family protein n=1 Tax=Hyphomicrobium sp. TaxID=82 RepID=UPI002E322FC3|nr:oligosaccharide flippase family protein [Hyphomicrobium sp.]HEX2842498.1 oligosaccharide flippase family protein [Hyphomicrobium sp.]
MQLSTGMLFRGASWIAGLFILSTLFRFGSNIYLTRLLTPEIMGALLVIMTVRNAVELLSDVGIGQNIVASKHGSDPVFQNTAWLIQCARGSILGFLMYMTASYIADLYGVPASAIELVAISLVASGLSSTSIYILQRNIQVARLSLFDFAHEMLGATLAILAATISPTIWALVIANVAASIIRALTTYLLPADRSTHTVSRSYAKEILHFGKWIFLMSALMLFCSSFDRLYLGAAVPLALVGIYGIARTISDIPAMLAARLCHTLVFPAIASAASRPREDLRSQLATTRLRALTFGALCMGIGISISDLVINFVYDQRYQEAGLMLPILLMGVWFAIIANINEYALLGVSRPAYGVGGNMLKAGYLLIGLPLALAVGGLMLALAVLATADLLRLVPLAIGLKREQLTFFTQDAACTLIVVVTAIIVAILRYSLGFGAGFLRFLI